MCWEVLDLQASENIFENVDHHCTEGSCDAASCTADSSQVTLHKAKHCAEESCGPTSCKATYIKEVTDQIRCKKARPFIAEERSQHIEDQAEDYLAEGMSPADAEAAAVREMGDPIKVGTDLDRIHRPKPDWKLIIIIALLTLAGLVLQYIAANNGS